MKPLEIGRLVAAACLATALEVRADVLTFDGDICEANPCSNGALIRNDYGDTASVDVIYRNIAPNGLENRLLFWFEGYSDLNRVAWTSGGDAASIAEIFLKPLFADATVTLNSFDLGSFFGSRTTSYRILDGDENLLFSSDVFTVDGLIHSHLDVGLSSASGIRLQWGPSAFNVGIDNVNFTVRRETNEVPGPALSGLMVLALGMLLARRRETQVI